jgi:hypothetical protein
VIVGSERGKLPLEWRVVPEYAVEVRPARSVALPELRMTWLAMAFMALVMPCMASNPSPTIGGADCAAQPLA